MNKLYLAALLLVCSTAHSEEGFLGYGVGVFNDANYYTGQNKYFEGGYRASVWDGIYWQYKGGFWGEGSPDAARKSGFFVSSGPGFEVDLAPVEIRTGWGLAAISNPDSQLGGRFPQFNGNFALGLRDKKGDGIAIEYNHISSAGLVTPNQGRDFLILELSQKW